MFTLTVVYLLVEVIEYINYVVFIIGGSLGGATAFFTIRNEMRKAKKEQREWIQNSITNEGSRVITQVKDQLNVVDERFRRTELADKENKEDIEDIEDDIKVMTSDLKDICNKLSKHDYIVDQVLPEYKTLKDEFYKFKQSVDTNLFNNSSQRVSYQQANSTDKGNRENINDGRIEE